ncbi:putative kh domain protein [Phaeomoniella chlamydospora]|uniref:Putative kh domain protein n=1 Tax=Phaeomoniella chlamydospora TaxID=158046 RepID=A0A0G2GJ74_PHACM|nr:putative kh domain protein [Phaeomoniella chlamydospora]
MRRPHMPNGHQSPAVDSIVNLSFNVPFASNLYGPDVDDILHSSPAALQRWTFPPGTPEGTPIHKLPISESSGGRIEAAVTSAEPKASQSLQRKAQGLVTNVCISGESDIVHKMRAKILNETPISLRSSIVDIDSNLIMDVNADGIRKAVLNHIDVVAQYTGTDIFLLRPKAADPEASGISYGSAAESGLDQRFRAQVFGDMESMEHAKTRILMMIDQIVGAILMSKGSGLTSFQLKHKIDFMKLELTMHTLICGRTRKNIKLIESATKTAIYFPPPFFRVFGYCPAGATRRSEDEVFIAGRSEENIMQAKQKLRELVSGTKLYVKDVMVSSSKIDNILLDRLDKVRKVMETNGTYVLFPQLGSQRGVVRVQGTEVLHIERTVREIMALAGQFYSASWWIMVPDPSQGGMIRAPSPADIRTMLSDICTNSGADLTFDKWAFTINGSDDEVKAAMMVIAQIPFVKRCPYQIRVKIELANEHKEFVSGKKNGKINKIMGQSNVQIIFDGFNEYNFYIDVCGGQYDAVKNGLELVEQEMPASISFHVPDQYHKRIIGIGGQHIQRIMKKYSVFVKFSNAMERGGIGKEDDDVKVDNVICRTPARNAQSLDLVKQEIMDMVEKVDADLVTETVVINRLYHRELIARMTEIDELEKKWNCKIDFPRTEMASDVVYISGPEYQVPQAVDAFLGMVPESHEITFQSNDQLSEYLISAEFEGDLRPKLKEQYEVDVHVTPAPPSLPTPVGGEETPVPIEKRLVLAYTRNNAGGLKDAIDFVISRLVLHGLEASTVKGAIPRPKSDSFEESLPFFDSKLLQHAPAPLNTDSPTRSNFGADDSSERGSLFDRLRKPGSISSFSSFIGRKNQNASPGSFFKHASSNASKASLVSMESRDSGYRNPWTDSGINLPEDETASFHSGGWPRFENKFPYGNGNTPGDATPKHDPRASFDSGRPSTSNSTSGYPAPIGPPR